MDQTDLTPWFPPEQPPVRPGAYQATHISDAVQRDAYLVEYQAPTYAWFDGERWGWLSATPERAKERQARASAAPSNQRKFWRGLAQEPQS